MTMRAVLVAVCCLAASACQQKAQKPTSEKRPVQITEIKLGEEQIGGQSRITGLAFRPDKPSDEVWVAFEMKRPTHFLVSERTEGSREIKPRCTLTIRSGTSVVAQSTDVKSGGWDGPHFGGWGKPVNFMPRGIAASGTPEHERFERERFFAESHMEIRFIPGASQEFNVEFVHTLESGQQGFREYHLRVYQLRESGE